MFVDWPIRMDARLDERFRSFHARLRQRIRTRCRPVHLKSTRNWSLGRRPYKSPTVRRSYSTYHPKMMTRNKLTSPTMSRGFLPGGLKDSSLFLTESPLTFHWQGTLSDHTLLIRLEGFHRHSLVRSWSNFVTISFLQILSGLYCQQLVILSWWKGQSSQKNVKGKKTKATETQETHPLIEADLSLGRNSPIACAYRPV